MPAHESREGLGSSWMDFGLTPEDLGTSRTGIAPLSRARQNPGGWDGSGPRSEMPAEVGIHHEVGAGKAASANHRQGRQKVTVWSRMTSATINLWGPSPYVRSRDPHWPRVSVGSRTSRAKWASGMS
jgi:hypothetical protein